MSKTVKLFIREWRKVRNVSQYKLANEVQMNQSYLSKLERNIKSPSLDMLHKIAVTLNVKPCQLYKCEDKVCNCEYKIIPESD